MKFKDIFEKSYDTSAIEDLLTSIANEEGGAAFDEMEDWLIQNVNIDMDKDEAVPEDYLEDMYDDSFIDLYKFLEKKKLVKNYKVK